MKKVCFAVPVRDKAKYLPQVLKWHLAQEYSPLEIILSDQGSTDESLAMMQYAARNYTGPNTVRVLSCPITDIRGMPAFNEHLNWIHNQTDADIFVHCSADDFSYPKRTTKVVEAYEKFNPSMVINGQFFADESGKYTGETGYPTEDGFVNVEELYVRMIGGSTIQSWTREFYEKIGGLQGVGSPDMVLPFLACMDKGLYYLNERLHCYVQHADPSNTGLEGVIRTTKSEDELMQLEELCHFQVTAGVLTAFIKAGEAGIINAEGQSATLREVFNRASSWQRVRQLMALKKVTPLGFKA